MKRRLIFCPAINDHSFVLLFDKGESGDSWSIRDYSLAGSVTTRYAREFAAAPPALGLVESLDAPAHPTADLAFWFEQTTKANRRLTVRHASEPPAQKQGARILAPTGEQQVVATFPIIEEARLFALPKARKAEDIRRMRHSPNSEDWVTWTAFALLQQAVPERWWKHMVSLATASNAALALPEGWEETPEVLLWRCVAAPAAYERQSRERMSTSSVPEWESRSAKPGPVEGNSEIDVMLHNSVLTVFVEAKLGSDISTRTSYDPERNQIIRNIDCLLADARGTKPLFWMLVRDAGPARAYTQLMERYRGTPEELIRALPHRDREALGKISENLSIVLWTDLMQIVAQPADDETARAAYAELCRRIC